MGADLCGYMIIGPAKIPAEKIDQAIKTLFHHRDETHCVSCGITFETEKQLADLGVLADDEPYCPNCGSWFINRAKIKTLGHAIKIVEDLIENWPPDFRDCWSRQSPWNNSEVIVFAGEMTWGDTPDGEGYKILERLYLSGLMEDLGMA